MNLKQGTLKEIHAKTHHNLPSENQRQTKNLIQFREKKMELPIGEK